jgi:ABC-type bacteriocin/lantibiotic exporter with double-glycine peptidase domain
MIFWITKQITLSVVLITVIHYIYTFFKNNLTIPQVKDLIHKPQQQYNEIYNTIKTVKKAENNDSMKDELKKYLAEIQKKPEEIIPSVQPVGDSFDNNFQNAYQTI